MNISRSSFFGAFNCELCQGIVKQKREKRCQLKYALHLMEAEDAARVQFGLKPRHPP